MKRWLLAATVALGFPSWANAPEGKGSSSAAPVLQACAPSVFITATETKAFRDCHVAVQMIPLRGGTFLMGDQAGDGQPYEQPVHPVSVVPFALGRFEVSVAEWNACVTANGCTPSSLPSAEGRGSYPVVGVSWDQAEAFGLWLSKLTGRAYRLPSEAEWEYAARAGETGKYPWAPGDDVCQRANLLDRSGRTMHPEWYWAEGCDDHFADTAPVGSFPPNAWGFNDMLGNVWEWVEDCWHSDFTEAPSNSRPWEAEDCRRRVNRGGGWGNNLRSLRLSNRDADRSSAHGDGLGFRIARDLSPDEGRRFAAFAPDATTAVVKFASAASSASPASAAGAARAVTKDAPIPQVLAVAHERDFQVHISVQGQQDWQKPPEHSQGVTQQDVLIATRLHSDGVLYRENLLNLDPTIRFAVKEQYIARQGLLQIKSLNGGTLPRAPEEIDRLANQIQATLPGCLADPQCAGEAVYRAAGVDALRTYSARDLEAAIGPPATGAAARWLYYFGYSGCPSRVHASNQTHVVGVRSIFVNGSRVEPWEVDQTADGGGAPDDVRQLCARYTVTADIRTGDVYVENLFIPAAPGLTVQKRASRVTRTNENLSMPPEVITWANTTLRKTREALNLNQELVSNAPFDGNYTVLGHFEGKLAVKLEWSFKPTVEVANLARPPEAPALQSQSK